MYPHGYLQRADARMWDEVAATLSESAIKFLWTRPNPLRASARASPRAQALAARICDYAETIVRDRTHLVAKTLPSPTSRWFRRSLRGISNRPGLGKHRAESSAVFRGAFRAKRAQDVPGRIGT